MKKPVFIVMGLTLLMLADLGLSQDLANSKSLFKWNGPEANFRAELNTYFEARSQNQPLGSASAKSLDGEGQKSIAKSVLFSLAIPGTGEFYAGSYLKGVAFLAVEAAAWPLYLHFENKGDDLENQFELFADQNWNEEEYWLWLSQESGIDRSDMQGLRQYERDNFTHFLPEEKNQQYYENIGKYNQFNIGWNDTDTGEVADSEIRAEYMLMRKDANDNFQRATNLVTLIMFNHVLSALDAAFTTRSFNNQVTASLRMQNIIYGNKIVPGVVLGVKW